MKSLGYVVLWPFGWLMLAVLGAYAVKKTSPVPLDLDDEREERALGTSREARQRCRTLKKREA